MSVARRRTKLVALEATVASERLAWETAKQSGVDADIHAALARLNAATSAATEFRAPDVRIREIDAEMDALRLISLANARQTRNLSSRARDLDAQYAETSAARVLATIKSVEAATTLAVKARDGAQRALRDIGAERARLDAQRDE